MQHSRASFFTIGALLSALLGSSAFALDCKSSYDKSVASEDIYWFSGATTCLKAGTAGAAYSNAKATMIYIHGWQPDSYKGTSRESFDRSADIPSGSGAPADLTSAWRSAGYNTGIFYWTRFADESDVKVAESKIYSTTHNQGGLTMRVRTGASTYVASGLNKDAATLFYEAYKRAMTGYTGNNIRLVGHSLGSQMVIRGAKLISEAIDRGEIPANLLPKRIALLDPAYLQNPLPAGAPYYGKWTGEISRGYVDALKAKGVIFEAIRSSGSTSNGLIGDTNYELMKKTAFRETKPWYCSAVDLACKHKSAVWHYLWEIGLPSPLNTDNSIAASAATGDARTTTLMNSTQKSVLNNGAYSATPGDDNYTLSTK